MSTTLTRCSKLIALARTVSAGFNHNAAVCNEDVYLWGANNQGLRWVKEKNLDLIYIYINRKYVCISSRNDSPGERLVSKMYFQLNMPKTP